MYISNQSTRPNKAIAVISIYIYIYIDITAMALLGLVD